MMRECIFSRKSSIFTYQTNQMTHSQSLRALRMRNLYRTSAALLSAGNVDLLTGNSTHFNVIENRGNYEGALFLARIDHNDSFQVFSGSGNHTEYEKFQKDMRPIAHHDQTLRPRPTMTIVETGPCTFETLRKFFLFINNEKRTRRTKVPFAVFK